MNSREHEHNWPVKGALMYRPTDGLSSDWSRANAISGTIYTIAGLGITYTPDTDCVAYVSAQICAKLSDITGHYRLLAQLSQSAPGAVVLANGSTRCGLVNSVVYIPARTPPQELTAGVTYAWGVGIQHGNGGASTPTITVVAGSSDTFIHLEVFKKP
jgi:hypothetical protein